MNDYILLIKMFSEAAKSAHPAISEALSVLKEYLPELRESLEGLCDFSVDLKVRMVERFESAGFDRADAILMTLDTIKTIEQKVAEKRKK
jgi:hypothetical protein